MARRGVRSNQKLAAAPARRRIIAAARRAFFAHGFRRVTMDDLARELGMSKKTLYAGFPSKTALLEAVLGDKVRAIEADVERITSGCAGGFPAALRELLACLQRHADEIQPPLMQDLRREAPELFEQIERRRRAVVQRHFGKLLNEGRKAGAVRKDIPTALVLEILLGAAQAVMNPSKLAELNLTPKAGLTAILRVILEGVITTRGRVT
jgi:AcrR family transcriptional regulator